MIRKFKLPDNGIPIRVGDTSCIYKDVYHPMEWHNGEPYRPRVETLVLNDTGTQVYMRIKDDGGYKIPGGSIDSDSSYEKQAENETNEEALMAIKDVFYTGVTYHQPMDRDYIAKGGDSCIPYVGAISYVYTAHYAGRVDKSDIEEKDLDDDIANNGKFYDIIQVIKTLKLEHIKALIASNMITDRHILSLLYKRLDELSVNEPPNIAFESDDAFGAMTESLQPEYIYHGSVYDIDVFHPMSLDLGNADQEPGWSTFCFARYELAVRFALMRLLQKYMYKCNWDLKLEKPYVHEKEYAKILREMDGKSFFVYTIDARSLNLGIGNDERFPEFTFREDNITPYKKDVVVVTKNLLADMLIPISMELNKYEKQQMDDIANLNRGWVSCMLNRDYSGDSAVAKLNKAVSDGKLKPGDDVVKYMNENGITLKDISFIERLHEKQSLTEFFDVSNDFEETIILGDARALYTSDQKVDIPTYDEFAEDGNQIYLPSDLPPESRIIHKGFLYEIGVKGDLTFMGKYDIVFIEDINGNPLHFLRILVSPPYRKLGIGSVLAGYAIRYQKEELVTRLIIEVSNKIWSIAGIRNWIKRFGDEIIGRTEDSVAVRLNKTTEVTESCEQNLSNLSWYHAEYAKPGFNPNIAGGWDEELYSKTIDHAVKQAFMSAVASDKELLNEKRLTMHLYTAGEDLSAIHLGKITMYYYGLEDNGYIPKFDWEWEEQEDFSDAFLDNLREEIHPSLEHLEIIEVVETPLVETVVPDVTMTKEWFYKDPNSGNQNCLVTTDKCKGNLRGRGEMIVFDKTLSKIYLCKVDSKSIYYEFGYRLPGGSFEPNEPHIHGVTREVEEETRITCKDVTDTGIRYAFTYDTPPKWVQEKIPKNAWWYGSYVEVFCGTYDKKYIKNVAELDTDTKMMDDGKWYPLNKRTLNMLTEWHRRAVEFYLSKNGLAESLSLLEDDLSRATPSSFQLEPIFIVCTFTGTRFGKVITKYQHCKYSHSGIALDSKLDQIYTFNAREEEKEKFIGGKTKIVKSYAGGADVESIDRYTNVSTGGDGDICVLCIFVPGYVKQKIKENIDRIFANAKKTAYAFGNVVNIVLNRAKETSNSLKMICSEFVDNMLKLANIDITNKPSNLVSPNDFIKATSNNKKIFLLFEGKRSDYNRKTIDKKVNYIKRTNNAEELSIVVEGNDISLEDTGISNILGEWDNNSEFYVEESVIFNKDNTIYNMDKFKSGKSNILLVTGLSGSGKSTLAEKYAKEYKAEWIELDIFEHCGGYQDDNLKEAGEVFYEYLSSRKSLWDRLKTNSIKGRELGEEINKFVHYCITWCKRHKEKRWVIEGVQIYSFLTADEVKPYPLIILGTSMKNSVLQRFKRNGDGKIEWGEELKDDFVNLINWYWDEEKTLKTFRKDVKGVQEFRIPEQGDFAEYAIYADLDAAREDIPMDVMEGWLQVLMEAKKDKDDLPSLGRDDKTNDYSSDAEDSMNEEEETDGNSDEETTQEEPDDDESSEDDLDATSDYTDDANSDDDTGDDGSDGEEGTDSGEGGDTGDDLDAGGSDYTEDAAGDGGSSDDSSGDSGEDTTDTGTEQQTDTQSGNNGVKNYTLLTDFESLYRLASEISDTIEPIIMEKPIQNKVLTQVRSNLSAIKSSIMNFITLHFKPDDYPFNLYYYEVYVGLLGKNLEMLEKNQVFTSKEDREKQPRKRTKGGLNEDGK